MSKALIDKLSEDMAYAILANKEIQSLVDAVLKFSSCVDGDISVTLGEIMNLTCPFGQYDVVTSDRSWLDVLKEAFAKTYYSHILSK